MTTVRFTVYGTPQPQGSKKAWAANGRAMMAEAGGTTHAAWRNAVAQAAHDNTPTTGRVDGALFVVLEFRFPMPQSRPAAVRRHGWAVKTTAPDIDKLQRAVLDGLMAGGLIRDDATVVQILASKFETTGDTGCTIALATAT